MLSPKHSVISRLLSLKNISHAYHNSYNLVLYFQVKTLEMAMENLSKHCVMEQDVVSFAIKHGELAEHCQMSSDSCLDINLPVLNSIDKTNSTNPLWIV